MGEGDGQFHRDDMRLGDTEAHSLNYNLTEMGVTDSTYRRRARVLYEGKRPQ